jgi:catechol 2,3-dioxygenase-like lactoylglutathione lyase family enzyme
MIRLDHTIVPAKDRTESAQFFAEVFGLSVTVGELAKVRVNEGLTLAFTDDPEEAGGSSYALRGRRTHQYAFHVGEAEFQTILRRLRDKGIAYGSEPHRPTNRRLHARRGGRGFYLEDPSGHLVEIMTGPEAE